MIAPRKRTVEEIRERYHNKGLQILEPFFTERQKELFEQGVKEFEEGLYYEAHESWEQCWRAMRNGESDDAEIIIRGLVQLAAGFHCVKQKRFKDAQSNILKAKSKIECMPLLFLRINNESITKLTELILENISVNKESFSKKYKIT